MLDDTTIAAIATPAGEGGIGIVRISGADAAIIGGRIFRAAGRTGGPGLPRQMGVFENPTGAPPTS